MFNYKGKCGAEYFFNSCNTEIYRMRYIYMRYFYITISRNLLFYITLSKNDYIMRSEIRIYCADKILIKNY